jgi:hypothetical protein
VAPQENRKKKKRPPENRKKKKRPRDGRLVVSPARPAGVAPPKASAPVCSCFESRTPWVIDRSTPRIP